MHPDLVKLLDLQEKDFAVVEVDTRLAVIVGEGQALDQELAEAERTVQARHRAVAEALKKRQEAETKIETYRKLLERQQTRTEQLRGQREIQAATVEMDLARSLLAKEEDEWAKTGDSAILLESALAVAEQKLEEQRATQSEARAAIAARRQVVEAERNAARAIRDASAAEVERQLRHRYERLRSNKVSRVVVPLAGAACGACFTTVPLNRRSQIRAGSLIDWCESCGVILYYAEDQVV
jgi:predicted  nucleic acid-binding Zn-ribbon protein